MVTGSIINESFIQCRLFSVTMTAAETWINMSDWGEAFIIFGFEKWLLDLHTFIFYYSNIPEEFNNKSVFVYVNCKTLPDMFFSRCWCPDCYAVGILNLLWRRSVLCVPVCLLPCPHKSCYNRNNFCIKLIQS